MTWQDRLKAVVVMTSPGGNVFEPSWTGNIRSMPKKVGLFEYPKVDGTITQDLGTAGLQYPLTLLFDGADNDLEVDRFFRSCKESGLWTIVHPVRGSLRLQLLNVTENMQPVKSGNLTVVQTEWIEPIDPAASRSLSKPQLAAQVNIQVDELNNTGLDQFVSNVVQDGAAETLAVESTTTNVVDIVEDKLSPLYQSIPALNAQALAIIRGIQQTIVETTIDTTSLAGQVQNLVQLPVLATNDIASRLVAYTDMIATTLGLSPTGITSEDRNIVAVQELAVTAAIGALSQTAISGDLQTRGQAIDAINNIVQNFTDITDTLDLIQSAFLTEPIERQYFSQSASYTDASVNIASAVAYLLVAIFDLAAEKRITLERDRTPIEITVTEYGTLGPGDENLELFVTSNKLVGDELLILKTGKEVIVYV